MNYKEYKRKKRNENIKKLKKQYKKEYKKEIKKDLKKLFKIRKNLNNENYLKNIRNLYYYLKKYDYEFISNIKNINDLKYKFFMLETYIKIYYS